MLLKLPVEEFARSQLCIRFVDGRLNYTLNPLLKATPMNIFTASGFSLTFETVQDGDSQRLCISAMTSEKLGGDDDLMPQDVSLPVCESSEQQAEVILLEGNHAQYDPAVVTSEHPWQIRNISDLSSDLSMDWHLFSMGLDDMTPGLSNGFDFSVSDIPITQDSNNSAAKTSPDPQSAGHPLTFPPTTLAPESSMLSHSVSIPSIPSTSNKGLLMGSTFQDEPPIPMSPSSESSHSSSSYSNRSPTHRRGRYPCLDPTCSRLLTSEYTRKVHMESHKPKPRKVIPCTADPSCKEMFGRQHDRLRHEVVQHRKVCEFSCGRCGRFFSSARMLEKHGGRCPGEIAAGRWPAAAGVIR